MFGGTLRANEKLFVVMEKEEDIIEIVHPLLPLLVMGNEYFPVPDGVQAGNILALAGFSEYAFKTATLMERKERRVLSPMPFQSAGECAAKAN